jgi:hypothetical protein
MYRNYKIVLLTVLTLSVFTLVIIELTGVTRNSLFTLLKGHKEGNDFNGYFYSKDGTVYRGEIFSEDTKTRCEKVARMLKTNIQFYESKYNFGHVSEGKVVKHSFRFKNTGQNPLMICKADVSCGCTVPSFQLEPVAPGQDGEISVEFNTSGKSGFQQKNIIVHSNAMPEGVSIGIEADVK